MMVFLWFMQSDGDLYISRVRMSLSSVAYHGSCAFSGRCDIGTLV
jgi:hypothetical protein